MTLKTIAGIPFSTQLLTAISVMIGLIIGGTVAYHYMEGWTWAQSFYFVVSTLTTVGYGDLHPTSDATRIFTAFFMLAGVAIALASLGLIGTSYLKNREEAILKREEKLKTQEKLLESLKRHRQVNRQLKQERQLQKQQVKKDKQVQKKQVRTVRKYKTGPGQAKKGPGREK
ncbi:MAG: hypothetical protein AYK23_04655 [Candidatus Proteinoplasmatales archaeon SG8-5]|nr:MAG: hypothetical protein AYK23_04655 [Candidatus Proteinoplasmatales archaeon SG8-5]